MRAVLLLVAAAALFGALPRVGDWPPALAAVVPVAVAIGFAVLINGRMSPPACMAGSVAALVGSTLWTLFPAAGGATSLALLYTERTLRIRSASGRLIHLVGALAAGAVGATLAAAYSPSAPLLVAVSVALAAVLAVAPLIVPADDARVVRLESAARGLGAPMSLVLDEAAGLLRSIDGEGVDEETRKGLVAPWRSLDRLIDARLRLESPPARRSETSALVVGMLDGQIREHVASLRAAISAATAVGAAEAGIGGATLQEVDARGEVLDEQTRALVEIRAS